METKLDSFFMYHPGSIYLSETKSLDILILRFFIKRFSSSLACLTIIDPEYLPDAPLKAPGQTDRQPELPCHDDGIMTGGWGHAEAENRRGNSERTLASGW